MQTDRDRLIELIKYAEDNPEKTCPHYLEADCFDCPYDKGEDCDHVARKADYLLANGVTLGKPLVEYLHPIDAYEGLKSKYLVFKADTGEQIVNCFVLRPDKDNTAVETLRFYAYITENKTLAEDIYTRVGKSKILPPCKVGDKVAVRACCECVATIPDNDECRNICPFEDDCECDACENANERIFNTEISSIFDDGFGWKITFKHLSLIEANFNDIGTSFFVGENAEQQAKEYEAKLKELGKE